VEETRVPGENHRPVASTPRHEWGSLITLVVIGIDYTGSSEFNYHMIMIMTTPLKETKNMFMVEIGSKHL
jgi:hypothetical protein